LETQARELVQLAARLLRHAQLQADALPAELQQLLRAKGLAMRHLHVLMPLAIEGPMIVNRLAECVALAPATTSQLVGELRDAKLITRRVDPTDRRRALVSIRNELRASVIAVAEGRLRPFRATLASLSEHERTQFIRAWQTLIGLLERDGQERGDSPKGSKR
jgi:DNA-binding MarR family transcriptional regulator